MQSIRGDSEKRLLGQARDAEPLALPEVLPSRIPIPVWNPPETYPYIVLVSLFFFFWSRCCTGTTDTRAAMCRGDWEKGPTLH